MPNSFEKKRVDTIIFDVDGTLFNGQSLSLPIFKNCLSILIDEFHYNLPFPSDKEILSHFGKQADEIYADLFLQKAPPEVINSFAECVEKAEVLIKEGKVHNITDITRDDHFVVTGQKSIYLVVPPSFCTCDHFIFRCIRCNKKS